MDVGEYNLGQYLETLKKKVDVPTNAVFFDEFVPSDTGSVDGAFELPHSIAIYERDGGSLWDRSDPSTLEKDARFARELVVTASWVIGNHGYTTEYVFRMDGGIDVRAGATGTTLNRGVNSTAEGDENGTTVAPKIAAPSHQHFFNFRIDFDVDGTKNRVVEGTRNVPSPFGNAFETFETEFATERFRDTNTDTNRHWAVESTTRNSALGKPTAYALEPIDLIRPYSDPGFEPLKHAPFAGHPFWVTRYNGEELYAGGDYPLQAPGRGPDQVRSRQRLDRRSGRRGLVHGRPYARAQGRAVPGDDEGDGQLQSAARRLLRREPGARRSVGPGPASPSTMAQPASARRRPPAARRAATASASAGSRAAAAAPRARVRSGS